MAGRAWTVGLGTLTGPTPISCACRNTVPQPYHKGLSWATAGGIRIPGVREVWQDLPVGKRLRRANPRFGDRMTGKVSLSCARENLCARGAVNLLLEIRCVRSSALCDAADTVTDP